MADRVRVSRARASLTPEGRERYLAPCREFGRRTYDARLEVHLLKGARRRAREFGLSFSLKREDIVIPEKCPVFGTPFVRRKNVMDGYITGLDRLLRPSIDRIDNSRGYDPDNIVVVSLRANQMKGNGTLEEMKRLVAFYEKLASDE